MGTPFWLVIQHHTDIPLISPRGAPDHRCKPSTCRGHLLLKATQRGIRWHTREPNSPRLAVDHIFQTEVLRCGTDTNQKQSEPVRVVRRGRWPTHSLTATPDSYAEATLNPLSPLRSFSNARTHSPHKKQFAYTCWCTDNEKIRTTPLKQLHSSITG